jgi:hypothetical protein
MMPFYSLECVSTFRIGGHSKLFWPVGFVPLEEIHVKTQTQHIRIHTKTIVFVKLRGDDKSAPDLLSYLLHQVQEILLACHKLRASQLNTM